MLSPGTRFGPYEIVAPIGAGGMGEVYRARDSRLQRTVALKVLSGKLASTPQLLARFEQEARAIAALQDPHICVLHDIGREGGAPYLVMEFLEGETLAARLRRGALPLAEVVSIGAAMAEALERAHRAGIVHRDLKPGNVMLTKAGAKLLDFGLAKSAASSVFDATTLLSGAATPVTQPGAVLGTFAYMSPEQLGGREADARSDIFALGCVLYEMAVGKPAHMGLQMVAPPALERLVRACLEPDPDARVQSAHDVAIMLRGLEVAGPAPQAARGGWKRWLGWALAAAAVIAAIVLWQLRRSAAATAVTEIDPPAGTHFDFAGNYLGTPVISPDGRDIVFAATTSSGKRALWLRPLDQLQARELPGTEGGSEPFWSPDSRSIGYFANLHLMVLSVAGGLPQPIATTNSARGGTWAPDGTIVFTPTPGAELDRVADTGGAVHPVTSEPMAPYVTFRFPYFLPGGKNLIYLAIAPASPDRDMLYFASLDGKITHPLAHSLTGGIYAAGDLLYSVNGTLMAQPMNADNGQLSGTAQPIAGGIYEDASTWRPAYSASTTGTLIYATGAAGPEQVAWVGRDGKPLSAPLPLPDGTLLNASVSPDGKRLAMAVDNGTPSIWIEASDGGPPARLTFGLNDQSPIWSPDGKSIAYLDFASGADIHVERRPVAGGAQQMLLAATAAPSSWSPDGREILCVELKTLTGGEPTILALPAHGGPARTLASVPDFALNAEGHFAPHLSQDGRWVSYLAGEPGSAPKLYVVPFHGQAGEKWQAASAGVTRNFWVKGGRELDVVDDRDRLLAIPVSVNGNTPSFGEPQVLATHVPELVAASPDGTRFLALTHPGDSQRIVVVSRPRL